MSGAYFITPDILRIRHPNGTSVPRVIGYWVRFGLDIPPAWVMNRDAAIRVVENFTVPTI